MPERVGFKWYKCPVCQREFYGHKPVGDTKVRDTSNKVVADAVYYDGDKGYAHLECKKFAYGVPTR